MMAQQQLQQNRVKVSIRNWQNATMNDLINFISRNARVAVLDAHVDGPLVVGFVNSKAEAESLMKWNGVRFAGSNLKFELLDGNGGSAGTSDTISFLRGVLPVSYTHLDVYKRQQLLLFNNDRKSKGNKPKWK